VSVPDAPASPSGVFQFHFPPGLTPGNGVGYLQTWERAGDSSNTQYREIYESGWVRVPTPDFQMQAVGVKLLGYVGVADSNLTNALPAELYFIAWTGASDAALRSAVRIDLCQQGASGNPPVVDDRCMSANLASDNFFTFGSWHHYEYVMILNDPTQSNGVFKLWWDGRQVSEYHDVLYRNTTQSSGFYGRGWNPVWGGAGGSSRTRDDYLQVDHLYLSGILL
jgi:hypothetical protein